MADTVRASTMRPIRLLMSFLTVGGLTMASRILGFVRDVMIAAFLGAGPVAEAFFVAFRLPNMFRRFFAEGAFNMAFVPMFAKKVEGDGEAVARAFGREAQSVLLTALVVLTILAEIAMPLLVKALASGFDQSTFELAVLLSRIGFPYILFISLTALYSGVLNSFGRFAAAAAAPTLLNIAMIIAMLLGWYWGWHMGLTLVWSSLAAGLAQLAIVFWAARRIGMAFGLRRPRLTPEVRRLVRMGIPAMLAGASSRSTLSSARRWQAISTGLSPGSPMRTGFTSCRLALSASRLASCSCPSFRVASGQKIMKARATP